MRNVILPALVCFLAFVGPVSAEQFPPRYTEALELYKQGQHEESLSVIRLVFDDHRNSRELRLLAAANYVGLRDYDSALAHMRYCTRDHRDDADCRAMLSAILRKMNKPRQAIQVARQAIGSTGDSVPLRLELAAAYYQLGRYNDARAHVRQALAKDASDFQSLYLDGLIFLKQGNFDNARFRFRNALNVDQIPGAQLVNLYMNMGFAIERIGDQMVAEENSAEAARRYQEARRYYAYALAVPGGADRANAALERVANKDL